MPTGTNSPGWGKNPTGQAATRDVPYIKFSGADVNLFVPLPDKSYHLTVPMKNGWEQPVEIWTHDVIVNGKFVANVFCKNITRNLDVCPLCKANRAKEQQVGRTLENKERQHPLKKRFVFPVMADEIPELSFMLYKVSQKFMEQLSAQFQLAGNNNVKVVLLRNGSGIQTTYSLSNSGQMADKAMIDNCPVPPVTADSYKEYLCSLEDFSQLGITIDGGVSGGALSQQDNGSNGQVNGTITTPTTPSQGGTSMPDGNGNPDLQKALDFVVGFGIHKDKKLSELDKAALDIISRNMTGEIQSNASLILNNMG